ncbi:MAG TPA: polyketide synthase dehydratase domain-containing protein [Thermomicrobiales bacterium]|nr:polyketide synthase dehydratase domain-containing protein [Thermomicrobiales bacterium]
MLNGECDLALAGGSQVWMPIAALNVFCQLGALSHDQQIRPFDKDANGTLLGEGIGMVVLKRLADAERDGDRIYAVLRGVGVASDGRGVSVMAPRIDGEEMALRRAYEDAGVSPDSIGLIEAHGTATAVGDVVEVQALTRVFGEREHGLPRCALGTVKSMISHTIPASGVAGLIKIALALHQKVLPPTLHVTEPNPKLELEKTQFYLNTEPRPWIHGGPEPRRAGINAFGFGGINAHAVVEEYRPAQAAEPLDVHYLPPWDSEVVILDSTSAVDLLARVKQVGVWLDELAAAATSAYRLADVAYTLNAGLGPAAGAARVSIVATSVADLRQKLDRVAQRLADPNCQRIKDVSGIYYFAQPVGVDGKVILLFPGEGAQYPNMLADLCLHFPEVREVFDRYDQIFVGHPRGELPSDFIFPRPAFNDADRRRAEERLMQMDAAIEAVQAANQAMFALLEKLGVPADACVGHSSGEYSAASASGVFDVDADERFINLGRALYQYYADASAQNDVPKAVLLAIGAPRERVEEIAREAGGDIFLAVDNCPHQSILIGEPGAAERARAIVEREGLIYERLAYDRAVHPPLFEPYTADLRQLYEQVPVRPARIPLYSCATSERYPEDPEAVRELFLEHWSRPVEFQRTIDALYDDGARVFVEVGPRGNLSAFVEDILRGRPACIVPANVMRRSGITQLNHLVGMLAAHGVDLNLQHLYDRRQPKRIDRQDDDSTARHSNPVLLSSSWPMIRLSDEVVEQMRTTSPSVAGGPVAGNGHHPPPVRFAETNPAPADAKSAEIPNQTWTSADDWTPAPTMRLTDALRPVDDVAAVLASHLDVMDQFLVSQQEIMQAFLQGSDPSWGDDALVQLHEDWIESSPEEAPEWDGPVVVAESEGDDWAGVAAQLATTERPPADPATSEASYARADVAPSPMSAQPPTGAGRDDVASRLLALVSDRTGYPIEMLDERLDMEADLGIDSIKRVEILATYRQQYGGLDDSLVERLTAERTLGGVIGLIVGDLSSQASLSADEGVPTIVHPYPLLGTIVSWEPNRELVAERVFDLARDRYLRDHTMGRTVATTDDSLTPLAIMPLTMSLEILAEAAACLIPGKVVVGMRDVHAGRWLAWEDAPQTLRVTATRLDDDFDRARAHVSLWNLSEPGAGAVSPVVETTVLLDDAYPRPVAPRISRPAGGRASRWTPDRLYRDVMFHGPAWQGVKAIDETGTDGIVARLEVLPTTGFFTDAPSADFVVDPVVLDAAGQAIGFWTTEHLTTGRVVFPFRLAGLDIFGPPRPVGEAIDCLASIKLISDHLVRSDIELVSADGALWMRLEGWEDKRFDVPSHLLSLILARDGETISSDWPDGAVPFDSNERLACRVIETAIPADHGFWKRVWAARVLSRAERERFGALRPPGRRQLEWLGARTAAKEAVQALVKQYYGLDLLPADIEIYPGGEGEPLVGGAWLSSVDVVPVVSLAHTDGLAVALAALPFEGGVSSLGIDIERVKARPEEYADVAFDDAERALIAAVTGGDDEWTLRCWCAKEAVGKALRSGLTDGPRSLAVVAIDGPSGRVEVEPRGRLAAANEPGLRLVAYTRRQDDLVSASTIGERAGP